MKKLVVTGLRGWLLPQVLLAVAFLLGPVTRTIAQQGCVMACPPMSPPVEVSLSSACEDVLTPGLIGVTLDNCPGDIVINMLENGIPIGDTIRGDMIGNTYMVIISHPASGQSCMTMITVVDKQAPLVVCPDDITFSCTADVSAYNGIQPEDISDCSGTEVFFTDDLIFSGQCMGAVYAQYFRTYTIRDDFGNATTCGQLISLEKADLADVQFPMDLSGINALACFPPPDTSPGATGYPTVNGDPIIGGSFCNLTATPFDTEVEICSGSYKILRTWTVIDWCDNNASTAHMQTIEVLDITPPVVTAPQDMTISAGASVCLANVILPPAAVSEDCSSIWTVRTEGPFGTILSNGGLVANIPVGTYNIIYKALSDCLLEGADTMILTIQDLQPPVPVCHQVLAIPVSNDGMAIVPASVFNSASYDNCADVYFKAKRMSLPEGYSCANPGNPDNLFDDFIKFCCEDIEHNEIMVILRVYDTPPVPGPVADDYLAGHFNDCMVQVEVQDKLPPQLVCPSHLTISCEFPFSPDNLGVFGTIALSEADRELICIDDPGAQGFQCMGIDGLATDNCSVSINELAPVIQINNCGTGTIIRTFTATDDGGLQLSCQQVITVVNYNLFGPEDITWPPDYMTTDICEIGLLDPDDLPAPFNQPLLNDGPCDLVGISYVDDVFDFSNSDEACFKILRTWKVVDWCQLNTQTVGIWTHIQVIKVINSTAPVIAPIADRSECSFDKECAGLTLDFEAAATDDCSGPASLSWRYRVDLNDNQVFDYVSPVITGASIEFSRYMPIGTHRVVYSVWDHCGNTTTVEQYVTVESCTTPSAICIHGLATNLMPVDTDGDLIADWGMVTIQASMFDAGSSHSCGNPVTMAFSSDPTDVTRIFDCSDVGVQEIEVWAIDDNGLADFCITTIFVQDNNAVCPPEGGTLGIIAGTITVPEAGSLSGAMIYLDGSSFPGVPSGSNGQFVFPTMPYGGDYVVRPVRNTDARNGVTTLDLVKVQKHLLGLEPFTTPYQYIAADANNSASVTAIDIVQLRKLILGYYNELPNNTSWRFIDKAHIFPNPHDPWLSHWPETYTIIPFSHSMNDVDFHAVKIGDLNRTAALQADGGMIRPRTDRSGIVSYEAIPMEDKSVYRIDITLEDATSFQALQFSFDWDQTGFKLIDWAPGELFTSDDFRLPARAGENASVAVFDHQGWAQDKITLLTLWVEDVAKSGYPFTMFLQPAPAQPVAYVLHEEDPVAVQLRSITREARKIFNRPNPFKELTSILYNSSREEDAILRIFHINGKLMMTRKVKLMAGENEFIVTKTELREPGMYMYEIESNFQYSTNRMIIVD